MRLHAILLATFLALSAPATRATNGVNFKRTDHLLHASFAYGLGLTGQRVLTKAGVSRGLAGLLAGTAIVAFSYVKERTDRTYERGDIEAGAVGAGFAFAMGFALEL